MPIPYRHFGTALATIAFIATSVPVTVEAATVAQREYKRGYNDCMKGRYDQNQHGVSYRKGCRAAENKMAKKKKPVAECPADVSQADRANYPGCN